MCSASIQKACKRGDFKSRGIGEARKLYCKTNPDKMKSIWTSELRIQQSQRKKRLYKECPEKHPNRKLANNRSKMSYPEKLVYDWLKGQSIDFEHQKHVDKYHVDFCIGSLVIEVDGEEFHRDTDYEKNRDSVIESYGFTIKHFPVKSILKYGPSIVLDGSVSDDIINAFIELRTPRVCIVCDKVFYDRRKTCSDECLKSYRTVHPKSTKLNNTQSIKELPVTKEKLEQLVSELPMTHIGKRFNVSDNAIRKWCKKYGIETRRKFECSKDELQTMIESGLSRRAISEKVGVGGDRIQRMVEHYGLSVESRCVRYSDNTINSVLEYIKNGLKNIEIATLMNMDHKQVSAIRCKYKKEMV